jgi:hypothetical protein
MEVQITHTHTHTYIHTHTHSLSLSLSLFPFALMHFNRVASGWGGEAREERELGGSPPHLAISRVLMQTKVIGLHALQDFTSGKLWETREEGEGVQRM